MQPRVLIISRDSWNDTNNSGNTLSNLFQHWNTDAIATIYCRDEVPNNSVCKRYFKISESLLVKKILGKVKNAGIIENFSQVPNQIVISEEAIYSEKSEKKMYDFFRKNRWHIFLWAREFLWGLGLWKSKELERFIQDFNPEILYFPTCDSFYMHNLLYFVSQKTNAKIVSFHCDDLVTYRQYSWSPWYWINRYMLRKKMDKTIALSDKNYCIIDEQAKVYQKIYSKDFDLLYKTGAFTTRPVLKKVTAPIQMVYTGNVIYGRINTIIELAQAIQNINQKEIKIIFEIYTANPVATKILHELITIPGVYFKGKVSYSEIPKILESSDVLLHVESFEKQQMLATALSFSTKIVDYLEAAKPIFAIGWENAASIKYLKENQLGFVASNALQIEEQLRYMLENQQNLPDYATKVWDFGSMYHNRENVLQNFQNNLIALQQNNK